MTRSTRILINCCLLLMVVSGCYRSVQNSTSESATTPEGLKITSESVVSAAVKEVEVPAGGSAEAVVRVTVQNGYHINANPPTYPYLKATELELAGTDGLSVGFIRYPDPLTKKFGFAEKPLAVYEGEVLLKVFLNAAKSAKQGKQSFAGKLRIQACDEQVCYPPGSKEIVIPVLIK